jgi:uncharacterized protein YndB with AHSA1/START domain
VGHIEATRDLSANPEALWGTVSDLANWDKWFTVHEKWLAPPSGRRNQRPVINPMRR